MIRVGDEAPDFELPIHTGGTFRLSERRGKELVVLYFYPQDFTLNCTKEACTFQDHYSAIRQFGVTLLGVSSDNLDSHTRFAKAYRLGFPLASDATLEVSKRYGAVWFGGLRAKRVTFLIDQRGIVRGRFSYMVRVKRHQEDVLRALKEMQISSQGVHQE